MTCESMLLKDLKVLCKIYFVCQYLRMFKSFENETLE